MKRKVQITRKYWEKICHSVLSFFLFALKKRLLYCCKFFDMPYYIFELFFKGIYALSIWLSCACIIKLFVVPFEFQIRYCKSFSAYRLCEYEAIYVLMYQYHIIVRLYECLLVSVFNLSLCRFSVFNQLSQFNSSC